MVKKELKFYEAPACEVVELKMKAVVLVGISDVDPDPDKGETGGESGDNPGDLFGG